jgi:hypothetical protein
MNANVLHTHEIAAELQHGLSSRPYPVALAPRPYPAYPTWG